MRLFLCEHATKSGIVEFHERDDGDPEGADDCPPYGCASLLLIRGDWSEMGSPAEIEVTVTVPEGAPHVGDGGDYPGWTRRL